MTEYSGIKRATLLIALDNGGINRDRSQNQQEKELNKFLKSIGGFNLEDIDRWLANLSDEQLEVACCGEATEMEELMLDAPEGTNDFLNLYFDEVC